MHELSQEMPVLEREEMLSLVGGKVVLMDSKGYLINLNNAQEEQYTDIRDLLAAEGLSYTNLDAYEDTTYFIVAGTKNLNMKVQEGSFDMNGGYPDSSCNANGDIEGNAITKDIFEFIADNTDVEWGFYSTSGGTYGRMITSNSGVSAYTLKDKDAKCYEEFYHSHPASVEHEEDEGSDRDKKYAKDLLELDYKKIGIYDAKTKKYIYYDENKEDFK